MNRKKIDFSRHIDNIKKQDIITGIESVLDSKHEDIDCIQNLDKMIACKYLK